MTFKGVSNVENYLRRTGSHATKEQRTGRIDAIPTWAQEPEQYYNSVKARSSAAYNQFSYIQGRLAEINKEIDSGVSKDRFFRLRAEKEDLGEKFHALQLEVNSYRELMRAVGLKAWTIAFYEIARRKLPNETFLMLVRETREIMGRPEYEVKKGQGEWTPEQREKRRQKTRRQEKRHKFRVKLRSANNAQTGKAEQHDPREGSGSRR
jgi:hypothetical protein